MKVLSTLALVGLSQAATGNFCQNQANYVPTAMAGHPGRSYETGCEQEMEGLVDYATSSGSGLTITDWVTRFAPAGRVAACATDVAGIVFSARLDSKARNCCTDGKHICDVVQGNLCADQTAFSPAALARDGSTCMAKELVYETGGDGGFTLAMQVAPSLASWASLNGSTCAKHSGSLFDQNGYYLDDQTAACCTSAGGNVCAAFAPTTTAAPTTTGAPTTAAGAVTMGPTSTLGAFIVAAAVAMHR